MATAKQIRQQWVRRRLATFYELSASAKGYVVGCAMLCVAVGLSFAAADLATASALLWLSAIILAGAFICEVYVWLLKRLEAPWLKWMMVPLAIMVSAFSLGSAANMINAATGQDPGLFPRTITLMAPIAAIPAIALIAVIGLGISTLLLLFLWGTQVTSRNSVRAAKGWIWLARLLAVFATMVVISPAIEAESGFNQLSQGAAGWMVQVLDMHADPTCGPGKRDRVRRINDDLVVVARRTKIGLVFRRERCPLLPE